MYELSKMVATIFGDLDDKIESNVTNSFKFGKFIKNQSVPDGYVMVSLDVKSLFINVPVGLFYTIIEERWDEIAEITCLSKEVLLEACELVIESTYFKYKDEVYVQKYGVPMGLPASPILANLIMEVVEERILQSIHFDIPFYKRYVNNCRSRG